METTRRNRKRQATHKSIMHSAKVLFEEHGLQNVTIDMITEGADVSRSTFFNHFASLNDLLAGIANEEMADILTPDEDGAAPDISEMFRRLNRDTGPYPQLMCEMVVHNVFSGDHTAMADAFELIKAEFEQSGRLGGEFSAEELSAFLFGSYFGLIFRKYIYDEPFGDPEEMNETIQKLIKCFKKEEI